MTDEEIWSRYFSNALMGMSTREPFPNITNDTADLLSHTVSLIADAALAEHRKRWPINAGSTYAPSNPNRGNQAKVAVPVYKNIIGDN